MANKKRKQQRPRAGPGPANPGGANVARRERKEEARAAREAERKRAARRRSTRRILTFGAIAVIGFVAISLVGRAASPSDLPEAAKEAARIAGCGDLERPEVSAPGGDHADEGEIVTYTDTPATSGRHAVGTLPPAQRVHTEPVDEMQAVHTLEHGSVIVYYRPPGEGGASQEVVDRLAGLVGDQPATYLIPYPSLPDGQALAFTAWNQRMLCPAGVTADQAAELTLGFAEAFACTSNAPEGKNGDDC